MKMAHGGYIKFSEDKGRVFYLKVMVHRGRPIADPEANPPVRYQLLEFNLNNALALSADKLVTGEDSVVRIERRTTETMFPKVLRNGRLFDNTKRAGEYLNKYVYHLDR